MNYPVILIVVVLVVYLVWKIMGTNYRRTKRQPRRFSSGRYRKKKNESDDL